ncbi:MAG: hypothetical protein ACRED9_10300 [Caulobacteraceae bacterium]
MSEPKPRTPDPKPSQWSEAVDVEARRLWAAGASAAEIGEAIGRSAFAVASRMRRKQLARAPIQRQGAGPVLADQPLPAEPPASIALGPRPWMERSKGECAFPIGTPATGEERLVSSCCNPCGEAGYCRAHLAVLRRSSKPRSPRPDKG